MSKSKEARMAYEARQAERMDQSTREKSAREEGIRDGIEKGKIDIARNLIGLLDDETIANKTGLSIDIVKSLKN